MTFDPVEQRHVAGVSDRTLRPPFLLFFIFSFCVFNDKIATWKRQRERWGTRNRPRSFGWLAAMKRRLLIPRCVPPRRRRKCGSYELMTCEFTSHRQLIHRLVLPLLYDANNRSISLRPLSVIQFNSMAKIPTFPFKTANSAA